MGKVAIVLVALLSSPTAVQAAPPIAAPALPSGIESELNAFIQSLEKAIQEKDRAALERLYAPEFVFIHAFGNRVARDQQIDEIMNRTEAFPGLPPARSGPDTEIIAEGNVVIVRRMQRAANGRPLSSTAIYARRPAGWQLLQMQGTLLAVERQAIPMAPGVLEAIAGRYRQDNGNIGVISFNGQQLSVQFPNRPAWRLTPVAQDLFYDTQDNEYRIERDEDGRVTGYVIRVRADGSIVRGSRLP